MRAKTSGIRHMHSNGTDKAAKAAIAVTCHVACGSMQSHAHNASTSPIQIQTVRRKVNNTTRLDATHVMPDDAQVIK
jgi:hypothetical protein